MSSAYSHADSEFADRILDEPNARWPVAPGRYRLVASLACPWASRAVLVRRLLGLEDVISLGIVDPVHDEKDWRFTLDPGGVDPVLGIHHLAEAYATRRSEWHNGTSVPAIVDVPSGKLVTNDFATITLDFSTEWTSHHRPGAPDLYPQAWRDEIDDVMARVYTEFNDAVYGAGFAKSQASYDDAHRRIFDCLDWLSERLSNRRYLVGDHLTEADVRLFTTLVRFDAVYHGHFKCNRNKITEDPVLDAYLLDLMQTRGVGDTVNMTHIKVHYHRTHRNLNRYGVVPAGPRQDWSRRHHREQLGGTPFGDATPPTRPSEIPDYRSEP
jgi:putative glutathione S-transferase